ncbi:Inner membrane ABC transporter permease protein ydcV [Acholeplasma hippikon]|uniref:Inner membrane ABC transporter permease protein ydcV n=2 Tax=Acholeplasma hippikon TaxID=264636 RepID=A0A449BK43_9MOLU|nr:Inner membrane ABC transporter permease protein ydcV [Acholeplasma hippikon]
MSNYPKATLEEYGYKDRTKLKNIFAWVRKIAVVLIVFSLYIPTTMLLIQSVNSSPNINSFQSFTLKWYFNMFELRSLRSAILNTLMTSFISTILATVLGTLIAVGMHALTKKRRQQIVLLNNIPILNADIVSGISLMLVFSLLLPIFPYIFGPVTLVLAHLFFTLPYVVLSVLPKLKEMDPNMMDAALDLGVKPYKALVKVIVPAIKAGIFSGMLLALTMSIDDFVISYYTTGNGFDNLSIWIYGSIGRKSLSPSVYAFSTLLTLFTLVVLVSYQIIVKKGNKKKWRRF